ncbi:hypothetical protein CONPUDRAFT_165999 [Coniophora puteana RWD-64-598 SS2]|uniref:F-box domain-containing protein n=1 Tax=Coniophora puteana (strain RWD-64-598) TaxID=741705 RepID=A0A5M3MNA1_CONPW|nr:uncharacterized protein CONPUDRAFT_165999 [Coniophora puteana RWD-64-598 SS2]EIW80490.1 hypothetical protein CONPUDRAFT_165999 [Coniophora puteana RWD-64-598 SS2]
MEDNGVTTLAPALRLPPELTAAIISFRPNSSSLLQLGHLPSLKDDDWTDTINNIISLLELWIQNSGQLTISFTLHEEGICAHDPLCHLIYALRQYSAKWSILKLVVCKSTYDSFRRYLFGNSLNSLKQLVVDITNEESPSYESSDFADHLAFTPHLTSLALDNTYADEKYVLPLTWAQMTELSLNLNLRVLPLGLLEDFDHSFGVVPSPRQIVLPHLTTLRLRHTCFRSQLHDYFDQLTLPRLATLEIDSVARFKYSQGELGAERFCALIERSGCSVQTVSVRDVSTEGGALVSLLEYCPELHELAFFPSRNNISKTSSLESLLLWLTPDGDDELDALQLPRLRNIGLGLTYRDASFDDIVGMVEGRAAAGLRKFELTLEYLPLVDPGREKRAKNLEERLVELGEYSRSSFEGKVEVVTVYQPVYIAL